MNKADVMQAEMPGMPLKDSEDMVLYKDSLFGYPGEVEFIFSRESLKAVVYRVSVERYDADDYLKRLHGMLKSKYGEKYTRFGIHRWREGSITLIEEKHSQSLAVTLIYSEQPLESISAPAIGQLLQTMKEIEKNQVQLDFDHKL